MQNLPSVWPIANHVIFDCDSTLSTIEGIDELARMTGHEYDVAQLTKRAMEGDVPLEIRLWAPPGDRKPNTGTGPCHR